MDISQTVSRIIKQVQLRGDLALCELAKRLDGVSMGPKDLLVSSLDLLEAKHRVSPAFIKAIKECSRNIRLFAELEKQKVAKSWLKSYGTRKIGQLIGPIESVGVYIPGGRFPYPSTVLMTAIPARIAGVRRVIMASPPKNLTPEVLFAAQYAGIDEIYRIGGAGAIAAMALGTSRINAVHLIVGPGNRYVTEAKRQLYGIVGIDSLAGPSEVVIIADQSVPLAYIETDLRAQAEHDPEAQAVLISVNRKLLQAVRKSLDPGVKKRVQFLQVRNIHAAIERANQIAPEHLELLIPHAKNYLRKIRHAGAIFLGPGSPAAIGDYVAGPSHVLPTSSAGRFSSGLSVATFLKRSSVIEFRGRGTERTQWEAALTMSQTEGMEAHAQSLRCRMQAAA